MTLIDAAVKKRLEDDSGVAAIVGARIYPDQLPPAPTLPALRIAKVSDIEDPEVPGFCRSRVQVSCYSNPAPANGVRDPSEVEGLVGAVVAAVHVSRLNGSPTSWSTATGTAYSITSRKAQIGPRVPEPVSGYLHVPVDVLLEFTESETS